MNAIPSNTHVDINNVQDFIYRSPATATNPQHQHHHSTTTRQHQSGRGRSVDGTGGSSKHSRQISTRRNPFTLSRSTSTASSCSSVSPSTNIKNNNLDYDEGGGGGRAKSLSPSQRTGPVIVLHHNLGSSSRKKEVRHDFEQEEDHGGRTTTVDDEENDSTVDTSWDWSSAAAGGGGSGPTEPPKTAAPSLTPPETQTRTQIGRRFGLPSASPSTSPPVVHQVQQQSSLSMVPTTSTSSTTSSSPSFIPTSVSPRSSAGWGDIPHNRNMSSSSSRSMHQPLHHPHGHGTANATNRRSSSTVTGFYPSESSSGGGGSVGTTSGGTMASLSPMSPSFMRSPFSPPPVPTTTTTSTTSTTLSTSSAPATSTSATTATAVAAVAAAAAAVPEKVEVKVTQAPNQSADEGSSSAKKVPPPPPSTTRALFPPKRILQQQQEERQQEDRSKKAEEKTIEHDVEKVEEETHSDAEVRRKEREREKLSIVAAQEKEKADLTRQLDLLREKYAVAMQEQVDLQNTAENKEDQQHGREEAATTKGVMTEKEEIEKEEEEEEECYDDEEDQQQQQQDQNDEKTAMHAAASVIEKIKEEEEQTPTPVPNPNLGVEEEETPSNKVGGVFADNIQVAIRVRPPLYSPKNKKKQSKQNDGSRINRSNSSRRTMSPSFLSSSSTTSASACSSRNSSRAVSPTSTSSRPVSPSPSVQYHTYYQDKCYYKNTEAVEQQQYSLNVVSTPNPPPHSNSSSTPTIRLSVPHRGQFVFEHFDACFHSNNGNGNANGNGRSRSSSMSSSSRSRSGRKSDAMMATTSSSSGGNNNSYDNDNSQQAVFDRLGIPLVDNLFTGYNAAVMAYGPTGSGKTYSIFGGGSGGGGRGGVRSGRSSSVSVTSGRSSSRGGSSNGCFRDGYKTSASKLLRPSSLGEGEAAAAAAVDAGLLPRMCTEIFRRVKDFNNKNNNKNSDDTHTTNHAKNGGSISCQLSVHVAAVEIYVEEAFDLLYDTAPSQANKKTTNNKNIQSQPPLLPLKVRERFVGGEEESSSSSSRTSSVSSTSSPASSSAASASSSSHFYLPDLTWIHCEDDESVQRLLHLAEERKTYAATAVHDRSSRAHTLFYIELRWDQIEKKNRQQRSGVVAMTKNAAQTQTTTVISSKSARLLCCDLAGSERIKVAKTDRSKVLLEQATSINLSLMSLGKCIEAVVNAQTQQQKQQQRPQNQNNSSSSHKKDKKAVTSISNSTSSIHTEFRNSVLTKLLKEYLGGNSKTAILVTVQQQAPPPPLLKNSNGSDTAGHGGGGGGGLMTYNMNTANDTIAALRFADRAKKLQCHASIEEFKMLTHKQQQEQREKEVAVKTGKEGAHHSPRCSGNGSGEGAEVCLPHSQRGPRPAQQKEEAEEEEEPVHNDNHHPMHKAAYDAKTELIRKEFQLSCRREAVFRELNVRRMNLSARRQQFTHEFGRGGEEGSEVVDGTNGEDDKVSFSHLHYSDADAGSSKTSRREKQKSVLHALILKEEACVMALDEELSDVTKQLSEVKGEIVNSYYSPLESSVSVSKREGDENQKQHAAESSFLSSPSSSSQSSSPPELVVVERGAYMDAMRAKKKVEEMEVSLDHCMAELRQCKTEEEDRDKEYHAALTQSRALYEKQLERARSQIHEQEATLAASNRAVDELKSRLREMDQEIEARAIEHRQEILATDARRMQQEEVLIDDLRATLRECQEELQHTQQRADSVSVEHEIIAARCEAEVAATRVDLKECYLAALHTIQAQQEEAIENARLAAQEETEAAFERTQQDHELQIQLEVEACRKEAWQRQQVAVDEAVATALHEQREKIVREHDMRQRFDTMVLWEVMMPSLFKHWMDDVLEANLFQCLLQKESLWQLNVVKHFRRAAANTAEQLTEAFEAHQEDIVASMSQQYSQAVVLREHAMAERISGGENLLFEHLSSKSDLLMMDFTKTQMIMLKNNAAAADELREREQREHQEEEHQRLRETISAIEAKHAADILEKEMELEEHLSSEMALQEQSHRDIVTAAEKRHEEEMLRELEVVETAFNAQLKQQESEHAREMKKALQNQAIDLSDDKAVELDSLRKKLMAQYEDQLASSLQHATEVAASERSVAVDAAVSEALAKAQLEFKQDVERMKEEHGALVAAELRREYESSHREAMRKLRVELQEDFESQRRVELRSELAQQAKLLQTEHDSAIAALQKEMTSAATDATARLRDEYDARLEQQVADAVSDVERRTQEELELKVEDITKSLQHKTDVEKKDMLREFCDKLTILKKEHEDTLSHQQQRFEAQTQQLRSDLAMESDETLQKESRKQQRATESLVARAVEQERQKCEELQDSDLTALREHLEREHQHALQELQAAHRHECTRLQREIESETSRKIDEERCEAEKLATELQDKYNQLKSQQRSARQQLRVWCEDRERTLADVFASKMHAWEETTRVEYDALIQRLREKAQRDISTAVEAARESAQNVRALHEREEGRAAALRSDIEKEFELNVVPAKLAVQQEAHLRDMQSVNETWEVKMRRLEESHHDKIKSLEYAHLQSDAESEKRTTQRIEAVMAEQRQTIEKLQDHLGRREETARQELARLRNDHKESLLEAKKDFRAELTQETATVRDQEHHRRRKEIAAVTAEWEEECQIRLQRAECQSEQEKSLLREELERKFEQEIAEAEASHRRVLEVKLKEMERETEQAVGHRIRHEMQEAQEETVRRHVMEATSQCKWEHNRAMEAQREAVTQQVTDTLGHRYAREMKDLEEQHRRRLARLENDHREYNERLKEQYGAWHRAQLGLWTSTIVSCVMDDILPEREALIFSAASFQQLPQSHHHHHHGSSPTSTSPVATLYEAIGKEHGASQTKRRMEQEVHEVIIPRVVRQTEARIQDHYEGSVMPELRDEIAQQAEEGETLRKAITELEHEMTAVHIRHTEALVAEQKQYQARLIEYGEKRSAEREAAVREEMIAREILPLKDKLGRAVALQQTAALEVCQTIQQVVSGLQEEQVFEQQSQSRAQSQKRKSHQEEKEEREEDTKHHLHDHTQQANEERQQHKQQQQQLNKQATTRSSSSSGHMVRTPVSKNNTHQRHRHSRSSSTSRSPHNNLMTHQLSASPTISPPSNSTRSPLLYRNTAALVPPSFHQHHHTRVSPSTSPLSDVDEATYATTAVAAAAPVLTGGTMEKRTHSAAWSPRITRLLQRSASANNGGGGGSSRNSNHHRSSNSAGRSSLDANDNIKRRSSSSHYLVTDGSSSSSSISQQRRSTQGRGSSDLLLSSVGSNRSTAYFDGGVVGKVDVDADGDGAGVGDFSPFSPSLSLSPPKRFFSRSATTISSSLSSSVPPTQTTDMDNMDMMKKNIYGRQNVQVAEGIHVSHENIDDEGMCSNDEACVCMMMSTDDLEEMTA